MNLPKIELTKSQKQSIAALALVAVAAGYDALEKLSSAPALHLSPWLSALLPFAVIVAGTAKTALSRSLDKSRSGTGGGIVGAAPDKAAQVTQGGTVTPPAGVQGVAVPAEGDLLTTIAGALTPDRMLTLMSLAGSLFSEQHKIAATDAAQQVEVTRGMSRDALLAGIAARADALAVRPAAPVQTAETPKEETQTKEEAPAGLTGEAALVAEQQYQAGMAGRAEEVEREAAASVNPAVPVQKGPALAPPTV